MLPSQCRPAGPSLPSNGGRTVAGRQPIVTWAYVSLVNPTIARTTGGAGSLFVSATRCRSFFFSLSLHSPFLSLISLTLSLSLLCTTSCNVCMLCCSYRADAVTLLRSSPSTRIHIYISKSRALSHSCVCVDTLDPLRESTATRVFYSNFRSAYLNSAPFFLSLFVPE